MEFLKFRNNNIILIGDTHDIRITQKLIKNKCGENYDVVFLGDGGEIGFLSYDFEKLNNLLIEKNIRMFYLRGNHSNPRYFNSNEYSNIIFPKTLEKGIFPNGKTCLFVNGALSIDRNFRKVNSDYWLQEITEEFDNKDVPIVDIVFAHDAPECFNHSTKSLVKFDFITKDIIDDSYIQREKMTRILENSKCEKWFSGHFHNTLKQNENGVEYRCLDINEMLEINF